MTTHGNTDLLNEELFGNEAGEDEDPQILASYFVDKPEFKSFYAQRTRFNIVKSRKGVGKSTLLARVCEEKRVSAPNDIVVYLKGADLVAIQKSDNSSPNALINSWQQRICSRVNAEIGRKINFAFTDPSITLIESSELSGLKDRNFVGALVDRIKLKASPIETKKLAESNAKALLERYSTKNQVSVWLFVDDIDATFKNTESEKLELSTFFSACRYLCNSVKGLCLRVSVRTDVWTIIANDDEALDKCSQYLVEIKWSNRENEEILSRKILSYFQRTYPTDRRYANLDPVRDSQRIMSLVFTPKFSWGGSNFPPDRPIYILSNGRPRWATHLCKLAGKAAYQYQGRVIGIRDIEVSLKKYGEHRLSDLYKEHKHQCPSLQTIVESFSGGPTRYSTRELFQRLTDRIIRMRGTPEIDGMKKGNGAVDIANLLYRVGFICGRDEHAKDGLHFVRYEDRPDLLSTRENYDDGLPWEIHPCYRQILRLRK